MSMEAQKASGSPFKRPDGTNSINGRISSGRTTPTPPKRVGGGTSLYDSSSPEPTKRADMNSRSFKSAVTRAHYYTQENYHQVASATMARAFGYPDIERGFRDIERDHMRYGSLSGVPRGIERRDSLERELEKRVKRDYGKAGIAAWHRGKG